MSSPIQSGTAAPPAPARPALARAAAVRRANPHASPRSIELVQRALRAAWPHIGGNNDLAWATININLRTGTVPDAEWAWFDRRMVKLRCQQPEPGPVFDAFAQMGLLDRVQPLTRVAWDTRARRQRGAVIADMMTNHRWVLVGEAVACRMWARTRNIRLGELIVVDGDRNANKLHPLDPTKVTIVRVTRMADVDGCIKAKLDQMIAAGAQQRPVDWTPHGAGVDRQGAADLGGALVPRP